MLKDRYIKDVVMVNLKDLVNILDTIKSGKVAIARVALEQQLDIVSSDWRKEAKFK